LEPDQAKMIESTIAIERLCSKRWMLLHIIISLTMAAEERQNDTSPIAFLFAFTRSEMNTYPNLETNLTITLIEFAEWYLSYLFRYYVEVFPLSTISIGSDEHLRLLIGETQDELVGMVSILGSKALASTFDILNIVRENISKLLISHPGLLECGSSANFNEAT
jgi:hypothetical protein